MVVKLNTAGGSVRRARCRHRKVVQNPHSVQADTHDYFLEQPKAGRLHPSSKSGPDMIISCGDLRLVAPPLIEKWSRIPTLYITLEGSAAQSIWCIHPPCCFLDEIWDLIESVSEGFPTYSSVYQINIKN